MESNSNASHAQIWDDSFLQNSWNDALGEYKKYHSIKARGADAEEVVGISGGKNKQTGKKSLSASEQDEVNDPPVQDPLAKEYTIGKTADSDITSHEGNVPVVGQHENSNGSPALPQHLIGQVHDEGLKNLLMSWYYAGYYTGLHEGKQTAAQENQITKTK